MITATARSTTFPRIRNALKSFSMSLFLRVGMPAFVAVQPKAAALALVDKRITGPMERRTTSETLGPGEPAWRRWLVVLTVAL